MNTLPDDLRALPALSRRLYLEADEGRGWACVQKANGEIRVACNAPQGNVPHVFQQGFAFDLLRGLNQRLANGGSWAVGWCNGWQRLLMIWSDHDGDPQFTIEDEEPVNDILAAGPDHFISQAFDAWALWRKSQDVLDLRPEETYKRAQGERRPGQP